MSRGMPSSARDIEQAKRNAAVARARVQTSLTAVKERLHPKALAANAAQTVKSKTGAIGETARKRPLAAGAAAGVAALVLFRKPIGKSLRRLFSRRARLERHEYKERLRVDRERRRAEKEARRAEKEARRAAKQAERDPETQAASTASTRNQTKPAASRAGAA